MKSLVVRTPRYRSSSDSPQERMGFELVVPLRWTTQVVSLRSVELQRRRNRFETYRMKKSRRPGTGTGQSWEETCATRIGVARPHRGMLTPVKIGSAEIRDVGAPGQYVRTRM